MKGPKPGLKLIEGGRVAEKCPSVPAWLAPHAAAEWRRAAPQLHERGLLFRESLQTLESYCIAAGMVRECEELMKRDGRVVESKDGLKTHPAFKMQSAAMREARLLAGELGITSVRRAAGAGKANEQEGTGDGFDADLLA